MSNIIRKLPLYLIGMFILGFFISIINAQLALSPRAPSFNLPTILIDPGHGGWDGGTHDSNGLLEKNIVLNFAFLLKTELEKFQFPIKMTRTTDMELSEFAPYQGTRQRTDLLARVTMATKFNADMMISLHVNAASDSSLCGGIVFYQRNSSKSKKLASSIQKTFYHIQPYNRQKILPGNFYILNHSPIPTVLVELAFITHPQDHNFLQNEVYLKKLAEKMALAIHENTIDRTLPSLSRYLYFYKKSTEYP